MMHGSSSVPQDWLAIINEFGGEIPETYGVPVEEIQEGIKYGVRKVNIDTDLRLASTGAIRRYLAKNSAEFDPRKYLKEATKAMSDVVKARYEAFGCAGQAPKIKVIGLEGMATRYSAGDLDQDFLIANGETEGLPRSLHFLCHIFPVLYFPMMSRFDCCYMSRT